jgi:hypothetical protein
LTHWLQNWLMQTNRRKSFTTLMNQSSLLLLFASQKTLNQDPSRPTLRFLLIILNNSKHSSVAILTPIQKAQ